MRQESFSPMPSKRNMTNHSIRHLLIYLLVSLPIMISRSEVGAFENDTTVTIGGVRQEWGKAILPVSDGGYLLIGDRIYMAGCWSGVDSAHILVTKLDSNFSFQWEWEYRGRESARAEDAIVTRNGRFVIVGRTWVKGIGNDHDDDVLVLRLTENGDGIWGIPDIQGGTGDSRANSIIQTSEGRFVVVGEHDQTVGQKFGGRLLVRISDPDTLVFGLQKTFASSINRVAWSVIECANGELAIVGHQGAPPTGQDIYFATMALNGNLTNERVFGGDLRDVGRDIAQAPDGSFWIVGETFSYGPNGAPPNGTKNIYLLQIDSQGVFIRDTTYGSNSRDEAMSILELTANRLVVAGARDFRRHIFQTNLAGALLDSITVPGMIDDDGWFNGYAERNGSRMEYTLVGRSFDYDSLCFDLTMSKISDVSFRGFGIDRMTPLNNALSISVDSGFTSPDIFIRRPAFLSDLSQQQVEQRLLLSSTGVGKFTASLNPPLPREGIEFYGKVIHEETGALLRYPEDGSYIRLPVAIGSVTASSDASVISHKYRMLSLPATPNPSRMDSTLSVLGAWTSDLSSWRALRWDPAKGNSGEYAEFGVDSTLSKFESGKSYWLISSAGATIDFSGYTALPPDLAGVGYDYFPIRLDSGFNQIGSPYPMMVGMADCRIDFNGTVYGLTEAADSSIIDPILWAFSDTGYVPVSNALSPWQGYFIAANCSDSDRVRLLIPSTLYVAAPQKRFNHDEGWKLRISAQVGGSEDCCTYLSQNSDMSAPVGYAKPPHPNPSIVVWVEPTGSGANSKERFALTALSDSELDGQFTLVVSAPQANTDVVLRFFDEGDSEAPDLSLVSESGYYHTVKPGIPLTIKSGPHGLTERYAIYGNSHLAEFNGQIPSSFRLAQNFPNPFNPSTRIQLQIPRQSKWVMDIFNIQGQKIDVISGESPAGVVEIDWDASEFASGVYLYRVKAGDFVMTKKMTLLK